MAYQTFPSEQQHKLEITFDGNHCLMPDANGELAAHIYRHYAQFFEPLNPVCDGVSLSHLSCGGGRSPVILPSWNPEPRLGLYQLYWPSGFSRSARIHVLLERDKVQPSELTSAEEYAWFSVRWNRGSKSPVSFKIPMTITRRVIVTEDVVLCELRDQRVADSGWLLGGITPRPQQMTLKEFVATLSDKLLAPSERVRDTIFLDTLPDVNIDLDALWRYDVPVAHLLDAALGALNGVYNIAFYNNNLSGHVDWDSSAQIDFGEPSIGYHVFYGRRKGRVYFRKIINGRVRDDLNSVGYDFGQGSESLTFGVTCSHPYNVTNASETQSLANLIWNYETETLAGKAQRRFARYFLPIQNSTDSYVLDLNQSGGGVGLSVIPPQKLPYQRHYYWLKDTKPTCEPMDVIRIQLLENMPVCSDAAALHLSNLPSEDCPCDSVRQVLVRDTAGIARTKIQNGQRFAPAQSMGFARHLACSDTGEMDVYELVSIGQGCCPPPGSSDYQECCEPWFTRFENLASVTEKAVGAEIAYGETIGQLKGTGETAYLIYKAYLSSSDVANGCAIDLSGIHSFEARNSRTSGTSPCTPSFSQCAIDYALLKMSGRLPVASGPPCGDDPASLWYEDLSAAGTGDDYHERTIKTDPGSCAISKKVYNFASVRTTVLTKGADYIVLKHWCDPTSSSSSSGVDDCCAQFTDYDMRCVGGVLQRWSRQYEVCWNGDCLETRILHYWQPTGETVGCCDCGSGVSSSSSSGPTEPPGCVDGVTVVLPGTGYQSGGPLWDIVSASYDMATGNWSVTATANANAGTAPSCGAYYVCDEVFNAASNPVVTNCTLGNSTTQNGPFCQGATVTITGTSTPPTAANCSTWEIAIKSWATPFLSIYFDCAACPDPI
jgi:hypothetical protein